MEPITFSIGSKGEGPGESSKNIHAKVKEAIRQIRRHNSWLFDRELALPVSPDNGFRRGLFGVAARRILNFEQNQDTHRGYYEDAEKAFQRWSAGQQREDADVDTIDVRRVGWKRDVLLRDWDKKQNAEREAEIEEIGRLTWDDFEKARAEFADYERRRAEKRASDHGQPFDETKVECINAAMTRGWRDIYERLLPPEADRPPDKATAERIIKDYQTAEPRKIGDINFFLWLVDKPHLWRFVETMRAYNGFQRRLKQYDRPIQFRYPRYNRRPEWFSFSESSPGHMYTIVSMRPMVIELCVFVPVEDAPILKKLAKGKTLTESEQARLCEPMDWNAYRLTPERLAERRGVCRDELEKRKSGVLAKANLDAVHDWTDGIWRQLMDGFFRDDPPLDLSRFERVMVRYTLGTDARLAAFVEQPKDDADLTGRLVVETDERQRAHWQGRYKFWFGPLADGDGTLASRRRFLREMPLVVGGIRLEYRGRVREDANPIFTLSCELDERLPGSDGKTVYPAPAHRIPKREADADESATQPKQGKSKKRAPAKRRKMPVGLRVLVIDLGMRHIATGAVVGFVDDGKGKGVLPNPLKPVAVEFINVPGVTLSHIQRHQQERRSKQRKACPRGARKPFEIRGAHLPRGQAFARTLLEHAENLKDDRRKKAANAILAAALKHGVDYIVFENLKGYRPEMGFGRRYNAALMNWNRRELVEFVKMEAKPFGIYIWESVWPHHTSRFCHRCGAVGQRFSHVTADLARKDALAPAEPAVDKAGKPILDGKGKQVYRRKWMPNARRVRGTPLGLIAGMRQAVDGGQQFCCTECGLMVNADYNAAMNLARKLADDFPAYQRYNYRSDQKSWVVDGQTLVGKAFWERAKALVQRRLNERFKQPADTPPAGGWPGDFMPSSA
jgi:IS605 OrfB family transposase